MPLKRFAAAPAVRFFPEFALILAVAASIHAQSATPAQLPDAPSASPASQAAGPALKINTRMVSVEVVVRDRQGRPVPGLTAKDFQVFEQILPKKDQHPQSLAVFQAVNWAELKAAAAKPVELPPGVYTNLVSSQKVQAPPTVLLFDGINTDLTSQLQVHRQMVNILKSIPQDTPVAIFLLGDRLRLLQTFTTDPKLLQEAAAKTLVVGQTAPDQEPIDNPDSLSALLENVPSTQLPPGVLSSLEDFEQRMFNLNLTIRMNQTMDAFRGIARYLDGYPGRKNLLWISTSFPIRLWPYDGSDGGNTLPDLRDFQGDMQEIGSALMDSKIAIYPVDAGGVRTQSMFEASARVRQPGSGQRMGQSIQREDTLRQGAQQVMNDLADETGGRPCLGDNDLGDCIKKAVSDASTYYEIAYYPDAGEWRGEYHRIIVKTAHSGVHLSYREGYYARPSSGLASDNAETGTPADEMVKRAACEDPLTATAILLMVKSVPSDQPGAAKYFLGIDAHMLTFAPAAEAGTRELGIAVGACTFDRTGQPLQFLQKNTVAKLNEQQFSVASHGVTQTFQFAPKPGVARVRLLVRDSASGRMGSVDIPYADATPPAAATSEPAAPPVKAPTLGKP